MGTVKFILLDSKQHDKAIQMRLSVNKDKILRKGLNERISPELWDFDINANGKVLKSGMPKKIKSKKLYTKLNHLKKAIEKASNDKKNPDDIITLNWLEQFIKTSDINKIIKRNDRLTNVMGKYNDSKLSAGDIGQSTFIRYNRFLVIWELFEDYKEKPLGYNVKNYNEALNSDFRNWLKNQNYNANYISPILKYLKTVILNIKEKDIEISSDTTELSGIKKDKSNKMKAWLSFENDIPKLFELFKDLEEGSRLYNHLYFFIANCYTGQRFSDQRLLNKTNIKKDKKGRDCIELVQVKTGNTATIPIRKTLEKIIKKFDGFPPVGNMATYNKDLKTLCEMAGLNEIVKNSARTESLENGGKTMINGNFKKYELVSSHTARRSYITNLIEFVSPSFLMGISGHKRIASLMTYISYSDVEVGDKLHDMMEKFNID